MVVSDNGQVHSMSVIKMMGISPHRVKCHKIIMIYPQPVRRHYHPIYKMFRNELSLSLM